MRFHFLEAGAGEMTGQLISHGLSLSHMPPLGQEFRDASGREASFPRASHLLPNYHSQPQQWPVVPTHAQSTQAHLASCYLSCVWAFSRECPFSLYSAVGTAAESMCLEAFPPPIGELGLVGSAPNILCFEDTCPVVSHRVCN